MAAAITAQELEMQMPDTSKVLSDEPETDSSLHFMQLLLLVTCLEWEWRDRDNFFIGADISIYFSYSPITPNAQGLLWCETLGFFLGIHERKLRYFSSDGTLILTPEEAVYQHRLKFAQSELQDLQESQRAEQECQRAEQAEATVEKLQEKLRSLGISLE